METPFPKSNTETTAAAGSKRRRPRVTAEELGNPSFLRSSKRGEQLRDSKRPRLLTQGARNRMRTQFLDEIPDFVRDRNANDPITDDVARIRHSLSLRASAQAAATLAKAQERSPLPPNLAALLNPESPPLPGDAAPPPPPRPEVLADLVRAAEENDEDGDPATVDLDQGVVSPDGVPIPLVVASDADALDAMNRLAGLLSPNGPEPEPAKPWLDMCDELDELRGRVPPAPLEPVMDENEAATDPRGLDPADAPPPDDVLPPMDRVVCRIQNWVVRLECVLDRLSVRRAAEQARMDMLERRSLRRWARRNGRWDGASPPLQYDAWYVERLAQRNGGDSALRGWSTLIEQGGGEREAVPVWNRSAPRVRDLVNRVSAGKRPDADRVLPQQWCEGADLVRRPALDLYSLVYSLLPQGGRYDVNNFAALKCSTMKPQAACLLYASSRAQAGSTASARTVCTGAKTPEEVAWTLHKLEESIWRAGSLPLRVERSSFLVSNVVASALLPYYVAMDKLARQCRLYCTYTPEAFPGATLRLPQLGKVAVLVYPTKLIIAGSKTKSVLARALRMAVRVTWRARYTNLNSEGARAMLRAHERVLVELLDDAARSCETGQAFSPWRTAIRSASSSSARR